VAGVGLGLLIVATVASAACEMEMRPRADGVQELWYCDTAQTSAGPIRGCQNTGVRVLP
jgi:hypothetical protein